MIHKISFRNFFSFKEEVSIDFVVNEHAPDTDAYHRDTHGNRISKIMTVVGANASGKTNLLRSVGFLKWFIADSFSDLEPGQRITDYFNNFEQYAFCKDSGASSFEITFGLDGAIYQYNLELTAERVLAEELKVKKESSHWSKLFSRTLKDNGSYATNFSKLGLPSDFDKLVRPNSSVLSAAKQISNPEAVKIVGYFEKIQTGFTDVTSHDKNTFKAIYSVAKYYHERPDIKEKVEKLLRRFDLGISKFEVRIFKRDPENEIHIPVVFHKHMDSDSESLLHMYAESGGTRNLFMLLKDIFVALETGDVVVLDELDNNLHPLMVPEIVNLFRSKNHNPLNAQLFFSTHNVQILSELDKQQIVLVEKNEDNVSDAWKLDDIQGVRSDENYYTKYLAGAYGGIPKF